MKTTMLALYYLHDTNFKPRTKHISLKYHHFHDQIANGNLQILKVDTDQNWADIFTTFREDTSLNISKNFS
jgi:hypothetical protein